MKTFLLAIAAVAAVALSAGSAAAQHPGGCTHCSGGHSFVGHGHGLGLKGHSHGWHPLFSKFGGGHGLFGFGLAGGKFGALFSNHGHLFGDGHGGFGGGAQELPVVDPRGGNAGQLVFPQHPFVRGPRDYFMYEDR